MTDEVPEEQTSKLHEVYEKAQQVDPWPDEESYRGTSTLAFQTKVPEAVLIRLDTRCIKWPFHFRDEPPRCGECDGCLAHRWTERTTPADQTEPEQAPVRKPRDEPHECRYCGYESDDPVRFTTYPVRDYERGGTPGSLNRSIFDEDETEYELCRFCERSYTWGSYIYGPTEGATVVKDINGALNVHLDLVKREVDKAVNDLGLELDDLREGLS